MPNVLPAPHFELLIAAYNQSGATKDSYTAYKRVFDRLESLEASAVQPLFWEYLEVAIQERKAA